MKAIIIIAAAYLILPCLEARGGELETLIEQLKQSKSPDGVSKETVEVAGKIHAIGPAAIPQLIALLKDPRESVRQAAAFTLRDMKGLKEENLEVLIEVYRRDDSGWIPWDIASIESPKAAEFLIDELLRLRETANQIGGAIREIGERAVPPLVQVYKREVKWDKPLEMVMFEVFGNLGSKATAAVDPLLEILDDEKSPPALRIHVMQALDAIGPTAERAVPALEKLRQHADPDLRECATNTIANIGGAASLPIFTKWLEANDTYHLGWSLAGLAALHAQGHSAGPLVAKYLQSDDWNTRVDAACTLGYIGYREGASGLIKLLDCAEDWRVVLSATEALGRMEIKEALPALTRVSRDHWFPPVRAAATTALEAIRNGIHPKSQYERGDIPAGCSYYEHAGEDLDTIAREEADQVKFPLVEDRSAVPETIRQSLPKERTGGNYCGFEVANGFLMGRTKGEWGGEISFVDRDGKASIILNSNVEAIYQTPAGIIATTGLAHDTFCGGTVYKLAQDAGGHWQAKQWRVLPAAARFSRLLKDGNLLVSCYGGIVLVSSDGTMKSLTRADCGLPPADKK